MGFFVRYWIIGIVLLLLSTNVVAHAMPVVSNVLEIDGKGMVFRNDGSLGYYFTPETIGARLAENVLVWNNGSRCVFGEVRHAENPAEGFTADIVCDGQISNVRVEDRLAYGNSSAVLNKVYAIKMNGQEKQFAGNGDLVFSVVQEPTKYRSLFWTYLKLGMGHIFTGVDHIFFIVGFALLASGFAPLVKSISGFTVSHSITLTLAALGILTLSPVLVEPLIALSIIFVGVQALRNKSSVRGSFWLIFCFGLFHGLGFAGSIAEVGFPKQGFVASLLGFNLGVEVGQLVIVLVAYPVIMWANNAEQKGVFLKRAVSCVIVGAGSVWLVSRLAGFF